MTTQQSHQGTWIGTVSGTLLSISVTIQSGDVIKTAVLASVGACASFLVSLLLRQLARYFRRK